MKVLIVEDEKPAARRLRYLLEAYNATIEVLGVVDQVAQILPTLSSLEIDLLFLDIHLSDGDSVSVFSKIPNHIPVIFTTAYSQYALDSYQAQSVDYLLKPINAQKLYKALAKYSLLYKQDIKDRKVYKQKFIIKSGHRVKAIEAKSVWYIFSQNSQSFIKDESGNEYLISETLDQLTVYLNPLNFFRINRKCIINNLGVDHIQIKETAALRVVCKDQSIWSVSRGRIKGFKRWLNT